jgi:hypothetical protein
VRKSDVTEMLKLGEKNCKINQIFSAQRCIVVPHMCDLNNIELRSEKLKNRIRSKNVSWDISMNRLQARHFTGVWSRLRGILLACGEAIAGIPGDRWTHGRCDGAVNP